MPRTLYLHIGAHRTATTSVQAFLHKNIEPLMQRGIFQPFGQRRHLKLMNELFRGDQSVDDVAAVLNKRADNKPHEIHSIVLTDEDVCMREDLSVLAGFRRHFDVRVVYALRRQDTWIESWYFQNIKWQWLPGQSHCSFDEFLAERAKFHWIHYDRYVRHLEALFGAENLRLFVFEKEQMPGGPVAEFCRQIGLPGLDGLAEPAHSNSSRSPEMAEFMRHLPLDEARPEIRNVLVRACERVDREVLGHTGKQSELLLAPAARRRLLAEYEPGNRALAERHFGRKDLFLAPLPDKKTPLAKMQLPGRPEETLQRLVAPLLSELIRSEALQPAKKAAAQQERKQQEQKTS